MARVKEKSKVQEINKLKKRLKKIKMKYSSHFNMKLLSHIKILSFFYYFFFLSLFNLKKSYGELCKKSPRLSHRYSSGLRESRGKMRQVVVISRYLEKRARHRPAIWLCYISYICGFVKVFEVCLTHIKKLI